MTNESRYLVFSTTNKQKVQPFSKFCYFHASKKVWHERKNVISNLDSLPIRQAGARVHILMHTMNMWCSNWRLIKWQTTACREPRSISSCSSSIMYSTGALWATCCQPVCFVKALAALKITKNKQELSNFCSLWTTFLYWSPGCDMGFI